MAYQEQMVAVDAGFEGLSDMRAADPTIAPVDLSLEEEVLFLITYMRAERAQHGAIMEPLIPIDLESRQAYLRGLFNMRPPEPASPRFLAVQDDYLQRRLIERGGPIDVEQFPPFKGDKARGADAKISLWQGDETLLKVGAATNGARRDLLGCFMPGHNCIDNAIHTYAGVQMRLACNVIATELGKPAPPSSAYVTSGYNLPAEHVIHVVAPFADGDIPSKNQKMQLGDCYRACLSQAVKNGITSISFCCISTGTFGFRREYAARIAIDAVRGYLNEYEPDLHVVFDMFRDDDVSLYQELLAQ